MPWEEFCDLISGLLPDTPLGRIIQIRTENDEEVLKNFTPEMKKIRNDWQRKNAMKKSQKDVDDFIASMQEIFKNMAGDNN